MSANHPTEVLAYFKALGDPTRLRLLRLLLFQEFNVQELMGILAMGQSRVSRHLKLLFDSGLADSRRDGLWCFYSASDRDPGRRFIESIRYLFEEQEVFTLDLQRAQEYIERGKLHSMRFFDSLAGDWESMKRSILGDLDLVGEIVRRIPAAASVADLGCGSGDFLAGVAGRGPTLIGVDSSKQMLSEAHRRLELMRRSADLRIGELEHLPLGDGEAEVAVINLVLHHLREPGCGIKEAARILRPGGTLILADFHKHEQESLRSRYGDHWLGFEDAEVESWLAKAGFGILEKRCFPVRRALEVFLYTCRKH